MDDFVDIDCIDGGWIFRYFRGDFGEEEVEDGEILENGRVCLISFEGEEWLW